MRCYRESSLITWIGLSVVIVLVVIGEVMCTKHGKSYIDGNLSGSYESGAVKTHSPLKGHERLAPTQCPDSKHGTVFPESIKYSVLGISL